MSMILQTGSTFRVRDNADMVAHTQLPVGTYTVQLDERQGEFFLERLANFELPEKIYGGSTNNAERILNTFADRPLSTGVLLSGVKGSGKTLLAKQVAIMGAERNIPTIVINKAWHGDAFNSFIQGIDSPTIILFDEFEKVYQYHEQQKILTLLDGVFPTKKLFILTTNETGHVSEFLRNRPGRIYYNFSYDTLGQEFIKEYCEDRLNNKAQINDILKYTQVFSFFNFDMLSAAVEEMNRYGETLPEVLDVLNIVPETAKDETYEISVVLGEEEFVLDRNYRGFSPNQFEYHLWTDEDLPAPIRGNKLAMGLLHQASRKDVAKGFDLKSLIDEDHESPDEYDNCITFGPTLIKSFDQTENVFTYEVDRNGANVQLRARRNVKPTAWKYHPDAI